MQIERKRNNIGSKDLRKMAKLILNIKINFTLAVIVTNFSESNSGKMFKPIDLKA